MTNGTGGSFDMAKIHEAIETFFRLIEAGYAPHCPHLTVFCEFMEPHRIPYESWLDLDMTYVELSDVVYRVSGPSKGADREVAFAVNKGIPVVSSLEELNLLMTLKDDPFADCPACGHAWGH